uniref:Capsid assembly protein n=1 Tax=viral metagenome TaxID=1070528 RepID=A0A6M3K755_9ZZZZ
MPEPVIEEVQDSEYTAEELEALGETPETPAGEGDKEVGDKTAEPSEAADKETKDETKETQGETETPAEKLIPQSQVESMMQERLTRHDRELQQRNQQLEERIKALEVPAQPAGPGGAPLPVEKQDLGQLMNDPSWAGWTMEKLKEGGYEDHYHDVRAALIARTQFETWRSQETQRQQETEKTKAFDQEIQTFKTAEPTYFDEVGRPNEKFKELYEWGATNGVYNLQSAFKLKNMESILEKTKKDAVSEYIKTANSGDSVPRAKGGEGGPNLDGDVGGMTDEQLQEAYVNCTDPKRETMIEEKMQLRGLM